MKNRMQTTLTLIFTLSVVSCTPKIVVMDRQTVLEQEAAGEWPEMEKYLLENSSVQGPTPFSKEVMNPRKARLYHVLNGVMVK